MKIRLTSDVYEISKRVLDIDRDYYVVYDTSKRKFEIHNSSQIRDSYCLTLPFAELDGRALDYINMTKCSNMEKIFKKIDDDNKSLENTEKNRVLTAVNEVVERRLNGDN